jgi:triosephosphate isomerase
MMVRQPLALANWKMEMTIAESLAFLERFQDQAGELLTRVQVVLCPPYTALHPVAQALRDSPIQLGAQTVSAAASGPYTGRVSARLAADAGAHWALLGHWELRRHRGEIDETVNRKVHRALEAGLRPILLVGEESGVAPDKAARALIDQLTRVLRGCTAEQVASMAFIYEPEWAIGVAEPAAAEHVGASCRLIRRWLASCHGQETGQRVPILYGGSVSPAYAQHLLDLPDVDGLGAGRKGRDPDAFAQIVRIITQARAPNA